MLSPRAARNGRVPIIAVSASLVEKDLDIYIDGGFDGWILKPISFPRLGDIMKGIVDDKTRRDNLYQPGLWERGGWFDEVATRNDHVAAASSSPAAADDRSHAADTKPSELPPFSSVPSVSAPSEGVHVAAETDDPLVKEEDGSEQTKEQVRLEST